VTPSKTRWLGLVLAVGLLAVARWQLAGKVEPEALVKALRDLGTSPWALPTFFAIYLVGTTALLPAWTLHAVSAVVWGYWPGLAVSLVCFNAVSNLHFWIGRWLGQERIEAWLERRGWKGAVIRGSGISTMIAVRQLPLPFVAVNVAAGASPLTGWQFFIGSGLGGLPPTIVYSYFASSLLEGADGARSEALLKALAGGGLVLLVALAPKLWVRWRAQRTVPR
jgi:uncharacterized membrane protein YdjX (TVP38/TMEM64 family)